MFQVCATVWEREPTRRFAEPQRPRRSVTSVACLRYSGGRHGRLGEPGGRLFDRQGQMAEFHGDGEGRPHVSSRLGDPSAEMLQALVFAEDVDFWEREPLTHRQIIR